MTAFQKTPRDYFTTTYEGYPAVMFDNTLEYNNFVLKLEQAGESFLTKIVKGKRAGKKRRHFIIMLVDKARLTPYEFGN